MQVNVILHQGLPCAVLGDRKALNEFLITHGLTLDDLVKDTKTHPAPRFEVYPLDLEIRTKFCPLIDSDCHVDCAFYDKKCRYRDRYMLERR